MRQEHNRSAYNSMARNNVGRIFDGERLGNRSSFFFSLFCGFVSSVSCILVLSLYVTPAV